MRQASLFVRSLVVDAAEGGFLMRRGWADSERRRMGGLVGVVLGSRRSLVLQVEGIWRDGSVAFIVSRKEGCGRTSSDYLRARHARSCPRRVPGSSARGA